MHKRSIMGLILSAAVTFAPFVGAFASTVDPTTDRNPSCGYTVTEDSTGPYPCGFDCTMMGNGICGPYGVTLRTDTRRA
jgi:hypothetical protein